MPDGSMQRVHDPVTEQSNDVLVSAQLLPNENTSCTSEQYASNVQESSGGHENVPERSEKDSTSEKAQAPPTWVRGTADSLEYWVRDWKKWIPAVYHNDIRGRLIDEAAQNGTYEFSWGKGSHVDDVTSYVEAYHTWGPKRANRPEILFQYDPPTVSLNPSYNLQAWYDQDRIVLGYDSTPVQCWSHLPATISSRITGQEIEALLRLDRRSRLSDLMARMPKKELSDDKVSSTVPNLHYSHFNYKQRAARLRLCCRSWNMYRASPSKVDRALELYLSQHFAQFEATRSVKGFHDLNKEEQNDVKALCKEMQGSHHTKKDRSKPATTPTRRAETGTRSECPDFQ
ncbi:MAG: hypothetical protein L6R36_008348 [Xanthoria steineri]|nr:MAG: hypothetical protein L6R36_008348 [Xanthoria steineri]